MSPGYCTDSGHVPAEKSASSVRVQAPTTTCKPAAIEDQVQLSSHRTVPLSNTIDSCQKPEEVENVNPQKPARSKSVTPDVGSQRHYCKTCCKTVLYMDHHCPFTGNCVGGHNYSHFLLSLVYAWIGLGYGIVTCLLYFGECWLPTVWSQLGLAYLNDFNISRRDDVCPILVPYKEYMFPVIGGFLVLTLLILFQAFLLLSDMSTYDVLKHFWTQPIIRLGLKRICERRYQSGQSRLHVLLLHNRYGIVSFVIPIKNP